MDDLKTIDFRIALLRKEALRIELELVDRKVRLIKEERDLLELKKLKLIEDMNGHQNETD